MCWGKQKLNVVYRQLIWEISYVSNVYSEKYDIDIILILVLRIKKNHILFQWLPSSVDLFLYCANILMERGIAEKLGLNIKCYAWILWTFVIKSMVYQFTLFLTPFFPLGQQFVLRLGWGIKIAMKGRVFSNISYISVIYENINCLFSWH